MIPIVPILFLFAGGSATAAKPPAAAPSSSDNVIRFYEWRVQRDPEDFFNYDKLGVAYIGKGRETGDALYYELAEKALKKSLELEGTHREAVSATAHLASVYLAEHRFQDALAYARKSLTFNTGDLSPYATIGDALLESGEYDESARAYSRLQPDDSPTPRPALAYLKETRSSNLEFIRGNLPQSIRHMRNAVALAANAQMSPESVAWTQFTLAEECFQAGDLNCAEAANEDALRTYPRYHRALAGLAKVRAAQGRFHDAISLYQQALAVIPLPAYAAALGDIYTKLGRRIDARKEFDLVETVAYLSALNRSVYNRDLVMFYVDHNVKLSEALVMAGKELAVRHDIYTWDCYAWTLFKNGKTTQAANAMEHALSQGTVDAMLFFHAGMIYASLGDRGKARRYLRSALSINPEFHVSYAKVAADTLAQLPE
jgi:tetratricopeptide (TPR) repeat protein